jgi:hypothetical protein
MRWGSTPDGRAVASRLTRSTVHAAVNSEGVRLIAVLLRSGAGFEDHEARALGGATDTRENTTEIR